MVLRWRSGGKLRKPPLRKPQSTPYARPPQQQQQAVARENGGGWLSKLVDPATRIITGDVTRILPSALSNTLFGSSEYDHGIKVNQDASDEIPEDISNLSMLFKRKEREVVLCVGSTSKK